LKPLVDRNQKGGEERGGRKKRSLDSEETYNIKEKQPYLSRRNGNNSHSTKEELDRGVRLKDRSRKKREKIIGYWSKE